MSFHVPNRYRHRTGPYGSDDTIGNCGAFFIPARKLGGPPFKVIASDGRFDQADHGWEHVSVSLPTRCPTWDEMCLIKGLFWDPEDCVMQLHPPATAHINNHAFCLHLWRPTDREIPMPPKWMVGDPKLGLLVG